MPSSGTLISDLKKAIFEDESELDGLIVENLTELQASEFNAFREAIVEFLLTRINTERARTADFNAVVESVKTKYYRVMNEAIE